ncbi:hypothetical protein Hokovirus_3_293 [Hokovirus HKV1]|uniref:Uncharacterized protein n=1 Tax=Hokovirus HKV1 TaxID=1977638 RepID=A0A1V0SH15_9VIRU|nr:hypothetical protein Hokovirus_3_293 [Hokovirus HKV1]
MFEIDIAKDIAKEEPELLNRNYVYLQLLEKRLKKFEYLEKININLTYFSSSDNSYLLEKDYSNIKHSDKYTINNQLSKIETIILKKLLEENLDHDEIFSEHLEKHICLDQEIYETLGQINLRYLGFKRYYQIYEVIHRNNSNAYDYNKNYYMHCLNTKDKNILCLNYTSIFVFEVMDNDFDKKYIFYSDFSDGFYKTNEFIKLDYLLIDKLDLILDINRIIKTCKIKYQFFFYGHSGNLAIDNQYFDDQKYNSEYVDYDQYSIIYDRYDNICHLFYNDDIDSYYYKNTYTKGIQKKN